MRKNKAYLFVLAIAIGVPGGYALSFHVTERVFFILAFVAWNLVVLGFVHDRFSCYQQQLNDMQCLQQASVSALVNLAQMRDDAVTGSHLHRLSFYAEILAEDLNLPLEAKKNIVQTIALHDIGKVAVPDGVLNKPGPLDSQEWIMIQRHPQMGAAVLESITRDLTIADPKVLQYLITAQEIALSHHERWDGSGYPQGLQGEKIPFSARLAAVCDVYDSLRSPRPYKRPFSHEEAVVIINGGKGTHFDPKLVDSFLRLAHRFAEVWEEYGERIPQANIY